MEQIGWPPELIRLMTLAWNHDRFISWKQNYFPGGCPLASIAPLCLPDSNGSKHKVSLECVWMTGLSMPLIWKNLETIDLWNQCSRRGSLKKAPKNCRFVQKPNKTNSFFNCFPQQWNGCEIQILKGFAPYPIDASTLVKKKKKKTKEKKKKGF